MKSIAWSADDKLVAYLQNNNIAIFSDKGEFQYSTKIEENQSNIVGWERNKPIVVQSQKISDDLKGKLLVGINGEKFELIPLNRNRFALINEQGIISHGDANDFIQLIEEGEGFVSKNKLNKR